MKLITILVLAVMLVGCENKPTEKTFCKLNNGEVVETTKYVLAGFFPVDDKELIYSDGRIIKGYVQIWAKKEDL